MKMQQVITDVKVAGTVSAGTVSTGLGTFLDLIPNDIGKLATLVGIILSTVLIYTHFRKGRVEYEKARLELLIIREKEAATIEAAEQRKNQTRRVADTEFNSYQ